MKGPYTEPLYIATKPPDSLQLFNSSVVCEEEEHQESVEKPDRKTKKLYNDDKDVKAESNGSEPGSEPGSHFSPETLSSEPNHKRGNNKTTVPELELRKLERGKINFIFQLIFLCLV